jgi:hypothetical protein
MIEHAAQISAEAEIEISQGLMCKYGAKAFKGLT